MVILMNDSHNNSETINVIGTVIMIIGIVLGIIFGFAFQVANYSDSYYSRIEYSFNWALCISLIVSSIFIKVGFSALACIARASEETTMMVYRLMNQLNNNNTQTNNKTSKKSSENTTTLNQQTAPVVSTNIWTCPKCGKINYNYVTTCPCGEPKP